MSVRSKRTLSATVFSTVLGVTSSVSYANTPVDIDFQEFNFTGPPTLLTGDQNQAGSNYLYENIITVAGTQVNAIVRIDSINEGASLTTFDETFNDNQDLYFAPEIMGAGSGNPNSSVDYTIIFVDTDLAPLVVTNFSVNSVDIDGTEYVEYGGFSSYTVGENTNLQISESFGNRTRFIGSSNYNGLEINDVGRVELIFGAVQSMQITMGVADSTNNRQFGAIFRPIPFVGATIVTTAPTVNRLETSDTTPTITGTLTPLGGSDTFEVMVNGVIYTDADSNLTVTNDTWSLQILDGNALSVGTFDVVATRIGQPDLADQTRDELVIVAPSNAAPVANGEEFELDEAGTLSGENVLTNDTDDENDTLTATLVTGPTNGTLELNENGTFVYTHNGSETTSDSFTYRANDGALDSNTATVTLSINSVNDLPVAVNDTYTMVTEGQSFTAPQSVLSNDTDAENDTLTAIEVTAPANGTLTLNANGIFTYVHDGSNTESDSFTYQANDGSGNSNIATVNLVISLVDDAPVAVNDTVSVDEDATAVIDVLGNDTNSDGNLLNDSIVIVMPPANGSAQLNPETGEITYSPELNFNGSDTFTYNVRNDGGETSNTASVSITVVSVNDAPIAQNDTINLDEDTSGSINVLLNDSDVDGPLVDASLVIVDEPSNGLLTLSDTTGEVNYLPNVDFNGTDSFTYRVSDDAGEPSNLATVNINVAPVNDDPSSEDQTIIGGEDSLETIDVLSNAEDPEGDTLTVESASSPDGTVVINDDGTLSFVANDGFTGTTVITYLLNDGNGGVTTAILNLQIDPTNAAPVATNDNFVFGAAESFMLDVLNNDFDPENTTLSIVNPSSEQGTVVVVDNMLVFTPNESSMQPFVISYQVSDSQNESLSASATINVTSSDDPVITLPADLCGESAVNANALYTNIDIGQATAVDSAGNELPVTLLNGNTYFPPGNNEAFWTATDSEGKSAIAIQNVCVNPLVSINKDQTVLEGQAVSVGVYLNGASPVYPVVVPFTVAGTADGSDHDLVSGSVSITSGTEATISFETIEDAINDSGDTVVISLSEDLNLGSKNSHIASINEGNLRPEIMLDVTQDSQNRLTVSQADGQVDITAQVFDPNIGDTFLFEWSNPSDDLVNLSNTDLRYSFDPSELPAGVYIVDLQVTDNGDLSDVSRVYIEVLETLPTLSAMDSDGDRIPDNIEGFQDEDGDGIADYLDAIMECNVLQESVAEQSAFLIEGDPGVCLRRGNFTLGKETGGAQLTDNDIVGDEADILTPDPEAENIGGIFDFIAYGLPVEGETYGIVIPQRRPVPENAVYRKFRAATGWDFFVEDINNSLWSTQGEPGYCPPPNKNDDQTTWTPGLTEGHWCVQLIIEEGGANDDDNLVNATIVDPGGVGVMLSDNTRPEANDDAEIVLLNGEIDVDVLANDTDADNDGLTLSSVAASIGTAEIVDNQIRYTAPLSYIGPATVTYGVTDENGATDQATLNIDIVQNAPPIAAAQSSQLDQGQSVSLDLLQGASDPENDMLSVVSTNNANVTIDQDGIATFTPAADFFGTANIEYTIADSVGNTATGTWQVVVLEVIQSDAVTKGGSLNVMLVLFLGMIAFARRMKGTRMVKALLTACFAMLCISTQANADTINSDMSDEEACEYRAKQNQEDFEVSYKECDNQLGWFVGAKGGFADTSSSQTELDNFFSQTGINARSIDVDTDGIGGGLFVGYQFNTYFSLQAGYLSLGERSVGFSGSSSDIDSYYRNAEEIYPQSGEGLSVNATLSYPLSERFKVSGSLGYFDWEGDYVTRESANQVGDDTIDGGDIWFGVELNYRLSDSVQLYASASQFSLERDETNLFALGARYFWGKSTSYKSKSAPRQNVEPVQSELVGSSDGVEPMQVDNVVESPAAAVVVAQKDSDNDGVFDSEDNCPNSDIAYQTDELGCTVMLEQNYEHSLVIYFANNSAEIQPQYEEKVRNLVSFINEFDVKNLEVVGHTSKVGSASINQSLSLKRAQALATTLASDYGLDNINVRAIGKGETMLLDTGNTEAAHSRNRRIELNISEVLMLPAVR